MELLPIDIFSEITKFLDNISLSSYARSNKQIEGILGGILLQRKEQLLSDLVEKSKGHWISYSKFVQEDFDGDEYYIYECISVDVSDHPEDPRTDKLEVNQSSKLICGQPSPRLYDDKEEATTWYAKVNQATKELCCGWIKIIDKSIIDLRDLLKRLKHMGFIKVSDDDYWILEADGKYYLHLRNFKGTNVIHLPDLKFEIMFDVIKELNPEILKTVALPEQNYFYNWQNVQIIKETIFIVLIGELDKRGKLIICKDMTA